MKEKMEIKGWILITCKERKKKEFKLCVIKKQK